MTNPNIIELPHITGTNITMIADKANCGRSYVWMILNGDRSASSKKAKLILNTAKSINAAIELRLTKMENQIQEID